MNTVLTASTASIFHSDRTARAAHRIALSSGFVAVQNASTNGPSTRADRSGPASVMFLGTISQTTVCREATMPSASTNATG